MEACVSTLTVFFEGPFWVGVYERQEARRFTACRVVFGAEPTDPQVHALLLQRFARLCFSPPVKTGGPARRDANPKRLQRAAAKQLHANGVGTKAQQALKLQQEQGKQSRVRCSRAQRQAQAAQRFLLRREKQRQKHKGH